MTGNDDNIIVDIHVVSMMIQTDAERNSNILAMVA